MVTRNNTKLAPCTLPMAEINISFPLLALVRYLLPFTLVNSYITRCSWENLLFATASRNVSIINCGVFLVTIPLLDFLIFHWIQWKSLRENSIVIIYKICLWTWIDLNLSGQKSSLFFTFQCKKWEFWKVFWVWPLVPMISHRMVHLFTSWSCIQFL